MPLTHELIVTDTQFEEIRDGEGPAIVALEDDAAIQVGDYIRFLLHRDGRLAMLLQRRITIVKRRVPGECRIQAI